MKTKKQKVIKLKAGMRIVPDKDNKYWMSFNILEINDTRIVIEHDDKTTHSYFIPSIETMIKQGYLKVEKHVEHPYDLAEKDKLYDESIRTLKIITAELNALKKYNDKLVEALEGLIEEIGRGRGFKGNPAYNKAQRLIKKN